MTNAEQGGESRIRRLATEVSASMTRVGDLRPALQRCAESIVLHLDAAFARIWTLDAAGAVLELQASAGMYTHIDGGHARVRVGAYKIGRIAEERLPHLTNDVRNDPRVSDREWAKREGLVSFAGYPLVREGRLVGVVAMFARAPLPKSTLDGLAAVADMLAVGIDGKRGEAHPSLAPVRETGTAGDGSRARLFFMADAIPHQVWTADADGQLDYVNQRVLEYFGRTSDEMIGKGWLEVLHPDDLAPCVKRWGHSLQTGEPYELEFRLWSANEKRYRWHLASALPRRDEAGRVTQWFGTNTDIDVRKRVEDSRRLLLAAGKTLAASLDYNATLAGVGEVCVPTVADWCFIDLIERDGSARRAIAAHRDPSRAALAAKLREHPPRGVPGDPRTPVLDGAGVLFVEEVTSADLEAIAGSPEHAEALRELGPCSFIAAPLVAIDRVVGVLTLITTSESGRRLGRSEVALAEELAQRVALALENARYFREATDAIAAREQALGERDRLIEALERSNRELDQFAYVASHDLKAPLRGIANLSQWLQEGLGDKLDDEGREHMALLRGRVARLEALIDGVLSYSRAGRVAGHDEPVAMGPLLAEAVELLAPPAAARVTIAPEMPTLFAERAPVLQVFLNLIGNAIKHGKRGDVSVDVTHEDAGAFHDFAVTDNGPGIAPQYHDRIWKIFQTLEARDAVEGTGIGLSVVKKIVETRGGRVSITSSEGAGATFHVLWPKNARDEQ